MNLNKKEEYEMEKAHKIKSKGEAKKSYDRAKTGKMAFKYIIALAIIALVIYGIIILAKKGGVQGEDFSQFSPSAGREHISENSSGLNYNSNPPSSGPHYNGPIRASFYEEEIPDERVIHNLEHGDVWIAYKSGLSKEVMDQLKDFSGRYVIVTLRENNPTDISLVAWARVDSFNLNGNLINEERVKDFIKRYDNKGLENVRASGTGY